ncbi:MAG: sec-independent protein translocase protein TatB [Paraglaciecola sp.]|jgi:sec-independent protein translocase protein TatB
MFDIGFFELLMIGIVGLLVLGPERLPGAMRSTMNTVRSVKRMANGFREEVEQQFKVHELHENLKKAELKNLKNLSPELQSAVDELSAAAKSVQKPYEKKVTKDV